MQIGLRPADSRLYVSLPAEPGTDLPPTPYSQLQLTLRTQGAQQFLEVSTGARELFPEFHRFATLLTETFENPALSATTAFAAAIEGWQEFVAPLLLLTSEQQTGLLGELLFLEALLAARGPDALSSWISRSTVAEERHDFRIGSIDLEVKTCRATSRQHYVHGLTQLMPADGHELFLLSVRLEAAGSDGGRSLADQVHRIRQMLASATRARQEFESRLLARQYCDADAAFYSDRMILADSPRLIRVNDECPRITTDMLSNALGGRLAGRIRQVVYQVNLDGLGMPHDSDDFKRVLGAVRVTL